MNAKFAYRYGEGTGYLHVVFLGEGGQGSASLVRSIRDGKLYVRKTGLYDRDFSSECDEGERCPEHHPSDFKIHATMINKYCNGGNLKDFFHAYKDLQLVVPEALIWRFLRQMLDALKFLHRQCQPGISHNDIFAGNILVDWPPHSNWRPNFLLADFGISEVHEQVRTSHLPRFPQDLRASSAFAQDYEDVSALAFYLMTGDAEDRRCKRYSNEIQVEEHYTDELVACADDIFDYSEELEININSADIAHLRDFVAAKARSRPRNLPLECVRPPPVDPTPELFDSYEALMHKEPRPPGPWDVVGVDPEAYRVIGVCDGPHCEKEVWFTDSNGIRMEMQESPGHIIVSEDSLGY